MTRRRKRRVILRAVAAIAVTPEGPPWRACRRDSRFASGAGLAEALRPAIGARGAPQSARIYGNADIDDATRRVARSGSSSSTSAPQAIRLSARVAAPRALVENGYPGIRACQGSDWLACSSRFPACCRSTGAPGPGLPSERQPGHANERSLQLSGIRACVLPGGRARASCDRGWTVPHPAPRRSDSCCRRTPGSAS
jgi:hypothetical protein